MKNKRRTYLAVATAIAAVTAAVGCNLTGGIDDAKSRDEIIAKAQALMDEGKCADAVTKLDSISPKDDKANQVLGWAHLCAAGATITKVGASLFNYSTSSNNLSVVGTLANAMIPSTDGTITTIDSSITAFTAMSTGDQRAVSLAFANIIKAAALIAKASADNVRTRRSDIAPTACLNTSCATPGTCTAVRMNDTDANKVVTALNNAATAVGSFSSLGSARDLAQRLGASDNDTADGARCGIFNQMLTE